MSRGTVNKVMLIGRLGSDPEVRYAPSGNAVANFSVATNRSFKDKDGNFQDETAWHRIVAWSRLAEFAQQYLKKGMRVYVEGRLQYRDWQDQNGIKRKNTEIVANDIQMLESMGVKVEEAGEEVAEPDVPESGTKEEASDEEVPF